MTVATNLGSAGPLLDAQYGSSSAPNSNEPLLLTYEGAPYLHLPGSFPNLASAPNSAALQITGDIDIAVRVLPDEWEPATIMTIVGKWIFGGASYAMYLYNDGLTLQTFGGSVVNATASLSFLTGVTQPVWLRATRDVDNGSGGNTTVFYWSPEEDEPTEWVEFATVVNTGTTSISVYTMFLEIGAYGAFGFNMYSGRIYRVMIRDGINGTLVFDADFTAALTTGNETSITEASPNAATVTIGRATSGRKSVAVVEPTWSLGADDFFEVPDDSLLDFGPGQSGSVMVLGRVWDTQVANACYASKADSLGPGATGWAVLAGATPLETTSSLADGASVTTATGPARTAGELEMTLALRDQAAGTLTTELDGVSGTPAADSTLNTAAPGPMRLGALSSAPSNYADMELRAAAVWRRALSPAEVQSIMTYYGL